VKQHVTPVVSGDDEADARTVHQIIIGPSN
jgi:hypothetical protein